MALAARQGRGGFCQGRREAPRERSEHSGEPLQVPTDSAIKPPEAGARDEKKKFRTHSELHCDCPGRALWSKNKWDQKTHPGNSS